MRLKESNRVLGPYCEKGMWRIIIVECGIRTPKKFRTFEEAQKMKRQFEKSLKEAPQFMIEDALEQYEGYLTKIRQNKQQTVDAVRRRLKAFFPCLQLPIDSLNPKQCSLLYQDLIGKYEVATHRRMLVGAKTFLTWCVKNKWLPKNPLEGVEGQGKSRRGKKQLRFDEAKAWLKTALELAQRNQEGAIAAAMTLLLGLRAHEIVSITARDIDHEGKLLWIPESKTEAGRRTLEIPGLLQPFLERLRTKKQPQELLFGEHWRDWPRKWVQQICTLAEVPVVTAHGMRGLHSTLALQAGASPQVVAASLGHQSYQTTLQHYAAPGSYEAQQQKRVMNVLQSDQRIERRAEAA